MPKLYVIAGHGAGDPGACAFGCEEAERVRVLAKTMKALGGDQVILGDMSRNYYADNGISSLNVPPDTCIVELHMDSAATEGPHGAHVVKGIGATNAYDHRLAEELVPMFPGRSELIVERDDLRNPNVAAYRGLDYRLVENGFISNRNDLEKFNNRTEELAIRYLRAFGIRKVDQMAMAPVTVPQAGTPVYRIYNPATGEHFFTASEAEKANCISSGWADEGTAWTSPVPEIAIYRLYNPGNKHFFTSDFAEAENLQKSGWEYEGVALFASNDGEEVIRLYNPGNGDHILTTSKQEAKDLVSLGWTSEGVAFHIK